MPECLKVFLSELSNEDKETIADYLESSDDEEVLDDILAIVAK
jgi:hypothetical protein